MRLASIVPFLCFAAVFVPLPDATAQDREADRAAIEKSIQSYVAAFNSHDAAALAEHWSPEGVYISRVSGESVTGRDALKADFEELFKQESGTKLELSVDSIEFVSPNVALERGTATILRKSQEPTQTTYSVVHVKRDGKWLIDRTTDEEAPVVSSHYEQLKDLEWMIGTWADAEGDESVATECSWTRNRNFITRSFAVSADDETDLAGMQIIGWDPAEQTIRSWVFDSDGGFAQGQWTKKEDRWIVQTTATLPDGRRGSATSIIRMIDENQFGWQRINRIVDGQILPNVDEVIIVRKD